MPRILQNNLLGGELGLAVNVNRIGRVRLDVISLAPVEYQIAGKENEPDFRRQFREQFCHFNVHPPCQCGIRLRLGDGADGGAMNDELWLVSGKLAADGGEIEQVKLVARHSSHPPMRSKLRRGPDEIIPNQAVRAGDPGERY